MIKSSRENNWRFPLNVTTTRQFLAWVVLISSTVIYGGLHMLAWNAPFQMKTEHILRRISAPTMMGYGVLVYGFVLCDRLLQETSFDTLIHSGMRLKLLPTQRERDYSPTVARASTGLCYFFHIFSGYVIYCTKLLYLLARFYLALVCFLILFHLLAGLFRQPNWGHIFHIYQKILRCYHIRGKECS